MTVESERLVSTSDQEFLERGGDQPRAAYGSTLALTVTLAFACFTVAMSLILLQDRLPGSDLISTSVIRQDQSAKTALYVIAFAVLLPFGLIAGPRLADAISRSPNGGALPVLSAILVATFAAAIIVARLLRHLTRPDGLAVVLISTGIWSVAALAALTRAAASRPWMPLLRLANRARAASVLAGILVLGTLLCVTHSRSLGATGAALGVGALIAVCGLIAYERLRVPRLKPWHGVGVDLAIVSILLLAILDVAGFNGSPAPPSFLFEPGIFQFQQDWILGPTNQLLGGGALLVNVPVSQYGVGMVYFLSGWFHIAPIGYGTFWFLDGLLTALVYVAGYCVLRMAGATRVLATSALALGVVAFIYNLDYPVGALPEEGPLRFGLPMAVILAVVAAARWPRRARAGRAAALTIVGVASVWALEGFAYTVVTFAAMAVVEAVLRPPGTRLRWLVRQTALAVAACVTAHLILAGATLVATGQLPDWGRYLVFLRSLLLGGLEGSITFGFEPWSPGLVVGGACLASAAAVWLLAMRARAVARRDRTTLIALAGTTAYAIASFSYIDNRSSTYLLLYISLPLLIAGALWLRLLGSTAEVSRDIRRGGLVFTACVTALMLVVALPSTSGHFSRSALAHAYPGGGLRAALHRLWHPPPIDPRAPEGERVLKRYLPGRHVPILLPTSWDLAIEILMRSGRANAFFIGDPSEDIFVPSVWMPKVTQEIAAMRPGDRMLTDQSGLRAIAELRGHRGYDLGHPVGSFNPQIAWILQRIDARFRVRPIYTDKLGFVVAELDSR